MHDVLVDAEQIIPEGTPEFDIACEAERDMTQLEFVFNHLEAVSSDSLVGQRFRKKVKKTLDDSVLSQEDSDQSVGRDTQFELFVGAVCCAAGLTPVDFEEPDVSCTVKGVKFGIAAKRLKNIENFEKRIRKAAKQIKASRLPGIIALDVCLAGNPENARVWQPIPDQEFAALWSAGLTRFVGRYHSRLQEWVRGKGVRGLVIHDHQVRLGLDKKWELDGMHFFVDAARENQRRHREFVAFQSQYRMGLPNLKVLG